MSKAEQDAYYRHISAVMVQNDALDASKLEGRAEGLAEGRAEERTKNAKALKRNGVDEALIAKSLDLTIEEVRAL
jgi:predicted transposase/invertase (TIGR01784 family)